MDRFLDDTSYSDQASLAAMMVILNSKQVNKDTSKNYHSISLFLDKILDGHLVAYAGEMLQDNDLTFETG